MSLRQWDQKHTFNLGQSMGRPHAPGPKVVGKSQWAVEAALQWDALSAHPPGSRPWRCWHTRDSGSWLSFYKTSSAAERLLWFITLSQEYYTENRAWQLRKNLEILKYNLSPSCDREVCPCWEGNWVGRGGAYAALRNHWQEEEQGDWDSWVCWWMWRQLSNVRAAEESPNRICSSFLNSILNT